jgi:Transglycosylase SLT domain
MKMALKLACTSLIIMGLTAVSAHAQLASYRDDFGRVVFINPDVPVKHGKPAKSEPPKKDSATPDAAPAKPVTPAMTNIISAPMPPAALDRVVQQSAEKNHVDPALVRAVISTESNWNSAAVSSKGALGLMQLTPGTAQRLGVGNAFDPAQNIGAGVQYLGMMLERYKGDVSKALAAYNAGPGAVDRFGGVPNFRETRNYVQKVTSSYFRPGSNRESSVFGESPSIYRSTDSSGRVVFVNE